MFEMSLPSPEFVKTETELNYLMSEVIAQEKEIDSRLLVLCYHHIMWGKNEGVYGAILHSHYLPSTVSTVRRWINVMLELKP